MRVKKLSYKEFVKYSQMPIEYSGSTLSTAVVKWCSLQHFDVCDTAFYRGTLFAEILRNYFFQA